MGIIDWIKAKRAQNIERYRDQQTFNKQLDQEKQLAKARAMGEAEGKAQYEIQHRDWRDDFKNKSTGMGPGISGDFMKKANSKKRSLWGDDKSFKI